MKGCQWKSESHMAKAIKIQMRYIGPVKEIFSAQNCDYFLIHQFKCVLVAQKNRLSETVLLSTHNICFG